MRVGYRRGTNTPIPVLTLAHTWEKCVCWEGGKELNRTEPRNGLPPSCYHRSTDGWEGETDKMLHYALKRDIKEREDRDESCKKKAERTYP